MNFISSKEALTALRVGLDKAVELKEPSSVALCDVGGNLIAFVKSDGGTFGTVDVAISKAYTAAAFRVKTGDLFADSQPGGEIYGIVTASSSRQFVVFGGGIPIFRSGVCVGAVGVSGGPVAADVAIAEAVVAALES
ncbi:hypothetical protein AJ87_41885 [Rhizobium yanglingense]|nr:hypothetical protein AJ87_41885 [Rhizobium yanglingense]